MERRVKRKIEKIREKGKEEEKVKDGEKEGKVRVEKGRGRGDRERVEKEQKEKEENYPENGVRICIDWVGEDAEGRGYCKMGEVPLVFGNFAQLLLRLDRMFDSHGYPQAFQERRSFRQQSPLQSRPVNVPEEVSANLSDNLPQKAPCRLPEKLSRLLKGDDIWQKHGKYCTVDLVVWSRRRTGWQGCVSLEGGPSYEYRSELELLHHMQELIKESRNDRMRE